MDAINLLANIALPTSSGAPAVPLQPGQIVQALVLELLQSGAFRLQLPQAVLDVRSTVPLTPGDTITLAAKGNGSAQRLDILEQGSSAPAQRAGVPADAAAAQTGRRPIGEAVILARLNVPDATPAPAKTTPVAVPTPDATPPRALADAVRSAAARQGGLAPLLADVEQAATIATLPAPVRAAVTQLLGLRLPLTETLTAADVKQAFTRSGVLLEPKLAAAAQAPSGVPPATQGGPDLKATLLVLRQALKAWAGETPQPAPMAGLPASPTVVNATRTTPTLANATITNATIASVTLSDVTLTKLEPLAALPAGASPPLSAEEAESVAKNIATALLAKAAASSVQPSASINPPPPYRGAPLTAQPPAPATIADDLAPGAVADRLIAGADAALSRQTLLQAASLPDAASLDVPRDSNPRWTFEVPFATPQGTGIVPFEIARDGRGAPAEARGASWRARFSLDLEPMGPVHALVTLAGDRASVTLWAERISTASKLNDNVALLGDALRAAELQPSELSFRVGTPRAAKAAAPGRFMDRAS